MGIQWLKNLRKILWDFEALTMEFSLNSKPYFLHGEYFQIKKHGLNVLTIKVWVGYEQGSWKVQEKASSQFNILSESAQEWPVLQELLQQYTDIFQEPKGLPPQQVYDHRIPIKEGSQPVNYMPYKYASRQKTVIENMIQEMLEARVIQHNHSPYARHVILVKKKDKSWRMSVDYWYSKVSSNSRIMIQF